MKSGEGEASSSRRTPLRFKPKVPAKKSRKVMMSKKEPAEPNAIDEELLMKLTPFKSNDGLGKRMGAKEVSSPQITFGPADSSMARSFPPPRSSPAASVAECAELRNEFTEPQDYGHLSSPITLPLRTDFGDIKVKNEEELPFSAADRCQKGDPCTAAKELGFMQRTKEPRLLFFQLPASLPILRHQDSSSASSRPKGCSVGDLPGGRLGKILVYKSGRVKMRIGEALFDVSAGVNCKFAQDVVSIDQNEKCCAILGQLGRTAVVTPDIGYMLNSV